MDKIHTQLIKRSPNSVVYERSDLTLPYKKVKQDIIPHFVREEMVELMRRLPPDNVGMFFQFAWRTGARVSEILNVTRGDLDYENDEISIRWLKNRRNHYRVIFMHQTLKSPLWLYSSRMRYDDRLWPFTRQRADQLAKKHGFDHCHKIRHSFAVNFLRQSTSPFALVELKELLGHKRIETTMEYLRVVPMQQKACLRRIDFD